VALAAFAPLGTAAADGKTAANPATIACPPAPAGWNKPPVTKTVILPTTTRDGYGGGYEQVAAGGNSGSITCAYHKTAAKQVAVAVSFALPTDPNPFNDFDFGCGNGSAPWTSAYRVYRVASHDQWALATLTDQLSYLHASELPAFESVTRQLLKNANGYAHSCHLVTKPTPVAPRVYFDVRAGNDNITTTFQTPVNPSHGIYRITKFSPTTAKLQIETGNGPRVLAIKLTRGIDYRAASSKLPAKARFHLLVTGSSVPGCRKGASGTLNVTEPLSVTVVACGKTFAPVVESSVRFYGL
jgi:hypothetical protein